MVERFTKRFLGSAAGTSGGVVMTFPCRRGEARPACLCDGGDSCRLAVTRTYRELRAHGVGDVMAFEAGLRVFRLRHPEASLPVARSRVAGWISDALEQ